ncbi:Dihydrolipoamide acyltransferase, partial [Giardia duodenalis]
TDEERAVKERHGSVLAQTRGTCPGCHTARALDHDMNCPKTAWTRTTRHDMIVSCLYLRLSREFNAELEVRRTATSDQNQKPDIWLIDKCKTIDVGVTSPARWTTTTTRNSRSTGTGPSRSSAGRTAPSTQSPGGT